MDQNQPLNPVIGAAGDSHSMLDQSLTDARACAALCAKTYELSHHDVESDLAHVNISVFGSQVFVAFRGTANIRDWLTDADVHKLKASTGAGMVHKGFYDAFSSVREHIDFAIAPHDGAEIYITGHSLGGALAVMCAVHFDLNQIPFKHLITFGQPRVGDGDFARFCDARFGNGHTRWVNQEDIVPRVPDPFLLGYRHSGSVEFLSSFGGVSSNPPVIRLAISDAFGWWKEWATAKKIAGLADHPIARYIERLSAL